MSDSTSLLRIVVCVFLLASSFQCAPASANEVRRFDIASQPLTSALLEFGRQSGTSVGFVEALTAGRTAMQLRGYYRNEAALGRLLRGTGLSFEYVDGETITIVLADQPEAPPAVAAESLPASETQAVLPVDADVPAQYADGGTRRTHIDELIVLGSHIAGADIRVSLPVTIWDVGRMQAEAAVDAGDLFRALPFAGAVNFNGVDTFFAGVNSARGDISSINLRELGTGNTLVLLNGRRMVVHPGVQTEGRVPAMTANMNVLPIYSLERIEMLRDGASAIYGADAVAGVVNNVLREDYDGANLSALAGIADGTGMTESEFSLHAGGTFNDGRSHLQIISSLATRSGVQASEHYYSRSSNLQPLLAGTAHENNTNFNNNSVIGTWGQFQLPVAVTQNGTPITSPTGIFHLQPADFEGCLSSLSDGLCIDDGLIDEGLYGDNNTARQLIPDLERITLILSGDHSLNSSAELYGEYIYYRADSSRLTGASAPLPSAPVTIPAGNYWNPFGPVTFADGRVNPNRLPGIDAPAEGLDITLDSSFFGSAYRPADAGQRVIEIENSSFRVLAGLRGKVADLSWDSALLHSRATTDDITHNRVSSTSFQRSLALQTSAAYNPFNGSGAKNPTSLIDANPNPAAVIAPFLIDVSRKNEIQLTMVDLRMSVPELLEHNGRPLAAALGIELRHEKFIEDRDHRFDGTTTFTDSVTGQTFESDVMGSSVTADSSGSRNVISLFSELALPLSNSLEIQFASRYENYSDVGDSFQPRLAFSWQPANTLLVRGSYSRGVRVPNLPQLNAGLTRRVLYANDWYRCQALLNKGEIDSLGTCGVAGRVLVESSRTGSQSLQPEDYRSLSMGVVISPPVSNELHATIDFWKIEQNGIVGLFGSENQIAVDYAERLSGSASPQVMRAAVTQNDLDLFAGSGLSPAGQILQIQDSYVNLDRRKSSGVDLSLTYRYDQWRHGALRFDIDATRLLSADQSLPAAALAINNLHEPAIAVVGAGDLLRRDARPLWRAAGFTQFERGDWRAGLNAHYVSSFYDSSAMNDAGGGTYIVDDMLTFGAYWELSTRAFGDTLKRIRIGARNLFDEDPPLADETFGYYASMHSGVGRFWYLKLAAEFN